MSKWNKRDDGAGNEYLENEDGTRLYRDKDWAGNTYWAEKTLGSDRIYEYQENWFEAQRLEHPDGRMSFNYEREDPVGSKYYEFENTVKPADISPDESAGSGSTTWRYTGSSGTSADRETKSVLPFGKIVLGIFVLFGILTIVSIQEHKTVTLPTSEPTPSFPGLIEPIAFSHSANLYAWPYQKGPNYPNVEGLGFSKLCCESGVTWKGSHRFVAGAIRLEIRDLHVPSNSPIMGYDTKFWRDLSVGYYLQFRDGAVFEDYTLSKELFLYRMLLKLRGNGGSVLETVTGAPPPALIEKVIPVRFVSPDMYYPIVRGQWAGSYEHKGIETSFVMQLDQDGAAVLGTAKDYAPNKAISSSIRGFFVDGRLTLIKQYPGHLYAVNYVSSSITGSRMNGVWKVAGDEGVWQAKYSGSPLGSVNELPVSPPE